MEPKSDQNIDTSNTEPAKDNSFAVPRDTVNIQDALNQADQAVPKISTVRTFQSDVAGSVKTDNVSMIKIALAEKERREQEGAYFDIETPKKKKTPLILLILSVFIVVAGTVGFVYWYFNKPPAPTLEERIAPQEPMILYSETQSAVSVTNKSTDIIKSDLKVEVHKKLDLGTVKRILITDTVGTTTKNLNAQEFLRSIRSRAPESLLRAIDPYYFIGAYSFAPHDVFIIFKINSYDTAYPAMLEWEKTLETDLLEIFVDDTQVNLQPSSEQEMVATNDSELVASSTDEVIDTTQGQTRTTADTSGNVFKDRIVQNKDVRALVNPSGRILFMYTFLDRKTLIIVSSEKGLKEVITRMTTGRIRR